MTVPRDMLYELLPALYRLRDDPEQGEPLRRFMELLTEQAAVIEESLAQLHDDMFVETAAPWALPYIAALIGLEGVPGSEGHGMAPRAEVANTIGYRRRKGTAAVLEQLARDVTGWPARVVEYFELLVATQHVNHVRKHNESLPDLGDAHRLEWIGTPFEQPSARRPGSKGLPHLVDVRRVASCRGRYNIPNVGVHLWRLREYGLTRSQAVPVDPADRHRFRFDPLGSDAQLYTLPLSEHEITRLAEPLNVPLPISRRVLARSLESYYGRGLSLYVDGVAPEDVLVCDLSDVRDGSGTVTGWAHTPPPAGKVAIDPVLGRLAFADDQAAAPLVSYHYGFSADIGGGEYPRFGSYGVIEGSVERVSQQDPRGDHTTVAAAIGALGAASGTVEVDDSGRYVEEPNLDATGRRLELRAASGRRPVLVIGGDLTVTGDDGELTLSGLLVTGGTLRVEGLRRLRLVHCTLVPGLALTGEGQPHAPGTPSLVVTSANTDVVLEGCITGGLRVHPEAEVSASDCIVDAGQGGVAYASDDGAGGGGTLRLERCTVVGKVHARVIELASNSIFLARTTETDDPARWPGPVLADRRQSGCVRFSYLPAGSRTPRRHSCQPQGDGDAARLRPVFTSLRYGDAGYCQLARCTPDEVRRGADDESEMGAFHDLYQPQREAYLQGRLHEYLRFGLEVGIFFAS